MLYVLTVYPTVAGPARTRPRVSGEDIVSLGVTQSVCVSAEPRLLSALV